MSRPPTRDSHLYLLNRNLVRQPRGLDLTALQLARLLLERYPHTSLTLAEFNPGLTEVARHHITAGRLPAAVRILSFFHWILHGSSVCSLVGPRLPAQIEPSWLRSFRRVSSHEGRVEKWVCRADRTQSFYWIRKDFDYLNFLSGSQKWKRDTYLSTGEHVRTQFLGAAGLVTDVFFRLSDHSIALTILRSRDSNATIDQPANDHVIQVVEHDHQSRACSMHSSLTPLIATWLQTLLTKECPEQHAVLLCDRLREYRPVLTTLRRVTTHPHLSCVAVAHNHHLAQRDNGHLSTSLRSSFEPDYTPYDLIVLQTQRQAKALRDRAPGPAYASVATGLPPEANLPKPSVRSLDIVSLGAFAAQKNHAAALRIARRVCAECPSARFRFIGQGRLKGAVQKQIEAYGLFENVVVEDRTDAPLQVFASSAVSILTSHYEGYPRVVLESLACGCPVVAFDIEYGPREMIVDGVNGVLITPGDESAFARHLIRLLTDDAFRDSLQHGAATRRQHLSSQLQQLQAWDDILQRLRHQHVAT
ncbi:glycosyltransferase [Synechococcus sp. RSCCF101]|uniref:glycosyltransferase n=1 Tax=Synechococcus sp. RSCCF101 TaxID=2511069 RepID=UPI001248542C|nr:glycosyltransferase [Synechococcus sp. RSCCF101]QEY31969.1 glycosyltransferase [Synechococcus sp. RSCCF101]